MRELALVLVMFWNVENFFDPFKNPFKNDYEFTPSGAKHWTWRKFEKKRDDISKVIMLVKDEYEQWPALIGLCEVENGLTLKQLTQNTPLAKVGYKFLIGNSNDKRGINTALLYDPKIYTNLKIHYIPIINGKDTLFTRDILYSKGVINNLDTVHIFVTHFPSKIQGTKKSSNNRLIVAQKLKLTIDSIKNCNQNSNIIIMGDFNCNAQSKELKSFNGFTNMSNFINLEKNIKGTYKFKAEWEIIDHFIISNNLIKEALISNNESIKEYKWIYTYLDEVDIFSNKFLLIPCNKYNGFKINRTMLGPRYLGGVSDHLPIILKIYNERL